MIVVTNAASVRGPTEILFWRINNFAYKLLKFKCAFKSLKMKMQIHS